MTLSAPASAGPETKEDAKPAPPGAPASSEASALWPHPRGGPDQTGLAVGPLPGHLSRRWVYRAGGPIKGAPVLGHGRAYVGSDDGHVHAIDLATGERVWAHDAGAPVEASPVVYGDLVVVGTTAGTLLALDRAGHRVWAGAASGKITGPATVVRVGAAAGEPGGRTLALVGSHGNALFAFDLGGAGGAPAWTYPLEAPVNGGISVLGERAVFGACDDRLHVVALADGAPVAAHDVGGIVAGSVALAGGDAHLATFAAEVLRLDVATGEVRWRYGDGGLEYRSSPALTEETLVIGGPDKRVHALERASGKRRWVAATRGRVDAAPVIAGDRVAVGSRDGRLHLLSLATGEVLDSLLVGGRIGAAPAVAPGVVVVATEDGEVHALQQGTAQAAEKAP